MGLLAEVNAEALVSLHERNYKIDKNNAELIERSKILEHQIWDLQVKNNEASRILEARIQELQLKNDELLQMAYSVKSDSHWIRENSDGQELLYFNITR